MGKTSFQSLDQLSKSISEKIDLLNVGQLNASGIEELTQCSQDLYERLIVIRHKTYEKLGTPTTEQVVDTPVEKIEAEPIQNLKEVEQESIFDFSSETKVEEKEPEMMSFDLVNLKLKQSKTFSQLLKSQLFQKQLSLKIIRQA